MNKKSLKLILVLLGVIASMACTSHLIFQKDRGSTGVNSSNTTPITTIESEENQATSTATSIAAKTPEFEINTPTVSSEKVTSLEPVFPKEFNQVLANRLTHQSGETWPEIQHLVVLEINPADQSTAVKHILDEAMGGGSYSFENTYYAWTPERNVSRLEPDGQIWEIEIPSEKRRVLASAPEEGGRIDHYEWSPKGYPLTFSTIYTDETNTQKHALWIQNDQDQQEKLLVQDKFISFEWMPNGDKLLLSEKDWSDSNSVRMYYLFDPEIKNKNILFDNTNLDASDLKFSSNENEFAYYQGKLVESEFGVESIYDVWVYDIETQETNLILEDSEYGFPHWTPLGDLMVFGFVDKVGYTPYLINSDGTNLRPLDEDENTITELDFQWSPDGRLFLFTNAGVDGYSHSFQMWDTEKPFAERVRFELPEDFAIHLIDW